MARIIRRKKKENTNLNVGTRVVLAVASGFALASAGVALAALLYSKALTGVEYIGEGDEYIDD